MTPITAALVVILTLIFPFGRNAQAQERTLKSKYEFGTPELDAAQKLYSGRKYDEALAAFQGIMDKAQTSNNWEELIYAMEKKALTLRRLERYDEAIQTMDKAIDLSLEKLPKGHFLVSKMYYTRGTTDHTLRDYYNARSYLDTALIYYQHASTYDSTFYGRVVQYKYYAYQYSEGSQDTLLKYLGKLVELEELKQKRRPDPDEVLILLKSYPTIYIQKGDFESALTHAIRAYKYAKEHKREASARFYAGAQYDLARVLYFKKDYSRALKIGLEAMPIVQSTPRSEMPEYYAFNNLIGVLHMALGDFNEALPFFQKAVERESNDKNVFKKRNRSAFEAQVIMNMGICYENLGDRAKSKELLEKSMTLRKSIAEFPNPGLHSNYESFGNFFTHESNWEMALISYDSALRNGLISYTGSVSSFPDDDITFSFKDLSTLTKKASSLNQLGQNNESVELLISANNYAKRTNEILMSNREDFIASEGKLFLSNNFKGLYETGIDACYALYSKTGNGKFFDEAVSFSRSSKAILFLEQAQEFDLVNNNLVPQEQKEAFFRSKSKIEALQQSFYELIDSSIKSDSVISLNDELLAARMENKEIKDRIESVLLENKGGESIVNELLIKNERVQIPEGEALIEFFYGERNIYVLGEGLNSISFRKIELNDAFEIALKEIINIVTNPPVLEKLHNQFDSFARNSSLLYQTLIEPTLEDLGTELKNLIIVPDEFLSRLPFEVLTTEANSRATGFNDLDYLIKSFSVQYELSSELFESEEKERTAKYGLLGIGFKESVISDDKRASYGSLPGTQREIEFLESSVRGTYLIGNTGNRSDFLNKARNYDILHLAVHGKADSINRYESSLIFNGTRENTLNTNDLYLAGLQARLAVLSACESGVGVLNKGEGTFSIARGFALVGVPSVVMSLWKVNDHVTSGIMVGMYNGFINQGKPINDALRQAKLSYLEESDGYQSHPYYWAAFLQLGENTVLKGEKNNNFLLVVLFSSLAFLLALAYFKKRKRAI